ENVRPNVLFIVIDDLNDWTTLFSERNPVRMPNLENLARRGTFFKNAYCPSPASNPSRSSILTGLRPNETGVYGNSSDWRAVLPQRVTLQKFFKNNGYYVAGSGKIFHHHKDWAFHDNASFNEYLMMSVNEPYPTKKLNGLEWYGSRNTDWGIWPDDITKTSDYKSADFAVRFLEKNHDQPFMLNIGIYKPHSPFFAPEQFFDDYPQSRLVMPARKENDTDDLPPGAISLLKPSGWFWEGMVKAMDEDKDAYRNFVQAYQACASFADSMVGMVIDELDRSAYRDNTIIVLWSDNGFHLGEKDHIEKFALWEKTTHVPYIIIAPGITRPGQVIERPVDLMTIFPTLADLCGLKPPEGLSGFSLLPLLRGEKMELPPALMTYMKGNHAVRSDRWRYIVYSDGSEELYDHDTDPDELNNLADQIDYITVKDSLRKYVPKHNAEQVTDLK
ncbi:MAG: iduronate-2-sulfatase, partial [Bacteroidetes bacterium]